MILILTIPNVSSQLAVLGYHVEVYANPLETDQGTISYTNDTLENEGGSVSWYHYSRYNSHHPYKRKDGERVRETEEVFIAWRYSAGLVLSQASKRYLWLHDLIGTETLPISLAREVCGICVCGTG